MAFDTSALIWCIAAPAGIMSCAAIVCWWVSLAMSGKQASRTGFESTWCLTLTSTALAFAWWLSVAVSVNGFNWLYPWTEEAWSRIVLPLLGGVFLASAQSIGSLRNQPALWIVFGWLAVVSATLVMPSGDAWNDMLPLHRPWIALISIGATFNAIALYRMADRNTDRWFANVILAGLACPAIIGAATYGALFQICLAAMVATLSIAVFAAFGLVSNGSAIIFPSVLFTTAMVASGRFYSYAELPLSAYGLAIFAPGLIAISDWCVRNSSVVVRLAVAGVVATSIVIFIAYRFLIA